LKCILNSTENFKSDFDLDTDKKLFDWSAKQTYIALGNMMTSAALVGIDSCPEGFHQEKQRLYYESSTWMEKVLSFMVAFGYRKADPANPKSRKNRGYCYLEIVYNCFTFNYMSILGF
jgi:nitroreductase